MKMLIIIMMVLIIIMMVLITMDEEPIAYKPTTPDQKQLSSGNPPSPSLAKMVSGLPQAKKHFVPISNAQLHLRQPGLFQGSLAAFER